MAKAASRRPCWEEQVRSRARQEDAGAAEAEGVADDAEAAKRPTQWRRCMPLPPILSAKPKPVGPRGRKKTAKACANANGEK